MSPKGPEREASLAADAYFDEHYFSLPQLFSLAHQLHDIHGLEPASILEIGPGNGFVSTFLRRAGYPVTTVDINPALEPDIVAPLSELGRHLEGRRFDLVVCCEVLEHLPLAELPGHLDALRDAGDRLYLTLPTFGRTFGVGGMLRLPKRPPRPLSAHLRVKLGRSLEDSAHFWEVGSEPGSSRRSVVELLEERWGTVEVARYPLNPYHLSFRAS